MYLSENEQNIISTLNAQFAKVQELKKTNGEIVFATKMKAPVKRIEKKYRYQIIIKVQNEISDELLKQIFEISDEREYKDVSVFVEKNPQNLT